MSPVMEEFWLEAVIDGADQRPDLVEHGGRFIEQFAQIGGLVISPGQTEDVVHALGGFAVVDIFGDVFLDLFFKLCDIIIQRIAGDILDQLAEDRDRFRFQIDFLEEAVEIAIQRGDACHPALPR